MILLLIVLAGLILLLTFSFRSEITGEATKADSIIKKYTYTTAICDGNKLCQDNIVECDGNNLVKITPISGAVVQQPQDWQDPRDNKTKELCNKS